MLQKQLKYLEFVQRVQNHTVWIQNLGAHFEKLEISTELAVIEAQTLQHNEHFKGIQAKNDELNDILKLAKVIFGHFFTRNNLCICRRSRSTQTWPRKKPINFVRYLMLWG